MSKIEWTNETWNPTTGCNKVSQGCRGCYAEVMHRRLRGMFPKKYSKGFLDGVETHEDELQRPGKWKKPSMVFVDSMSDLFHKDVPFEFIANVFVMMGIFNQHTYQVLTKRADRLLEFYNWIENDKRVKSNWPLKNVWIGVSCEDQKNADERIPLLLQVPAAVRFLSCEPLLGPIDICNSVRIYQFHTHGSFHSTFFGDKIHWVITGGESGHRARPMHPDWVRSIRDQCSAARVPFFFKQWGQWEPDSHVSFNGPFFIHDVDHCIVNIDGNSWPFIDVFDPSPDNCPLTKGDNAYWMAKTGKKHSGNDLDGKHHLEFPVTSSPKIVSMS